MILSLVTSNPNNKLLVTDNYHIEAN